VSAIVRFIDVTYEIGGRRILDRLSFDLQEGETLVLLGRSGSGKTTALRLINALITPTGGSVEVFGKPTTEWDPIRLRRQIGYVIQDVGLFPHLRIAENVGLLPKLEQWPAERAQARVTELLNQVDLPAAQFAQRYPRELSGGQRQRAGIARALAIHPRLFLLDEPFGALDPVTRLELQKQFLDLRTRTNTTSVFVTHDVGEALRVGTRIGVLREAKLEKMYTPDQFRSNAEGEAARFLACLQPLPLG
jgi:osmoprotectant transport system ATP-binding protein